ncbi:hypothetical protein [Nocardia salmonicida]|uniref:hypothetical protein n=1 Tax=Nocardia salmonicida TaxID=53431 RepID=UPI0033E4BCD9
MFEPNPVQAQLLKAVQNLAREHHHLVGRPAAAGGTELAAADLAHLDVGRRTREHLESVATAVGVPRSALDYTRAAGERGHRWQPGQPLLTTATVARDSLLAGHTRAVSELQTMAGVGAVLARHGPLSRDGFDAFRRVMGINWQRVGAVGHALALTATERTRAWQPTETPWASAVAQRIGGLERGELTARWRAIVDTDFTTTAISVTVLAAAGVTPDDISAQLPVLPDRMVEQVAAALAPEPSEPDGGGTEIGAAVDATATYTHRDHDQDPADGSSDGPRTHSHHAGPDP